MGKHSTGPGRKSRSGTTTGARARRVGMVLGLVASAAMVWQSSTASFTATTDNPGNSFAAGVVTLTDNVVGSLWFNATALRPGSTANQCVEVAYAGNINADIRLYSTGLTDVNMGGGDGQLADRLTWTVERGLAGATCGVFGASTTIFTAGTLDSFKTTHSSWANAIGSSTQTWYPGAAQTRPYKFTYTLTDFNDAQGDTYTIDLNWEARSCLTTCP